MFLDLVQHWMFTAFEIDPKEKVKIRRSITGPLRTMGEQAGKIPNWAPAWWSGDDDATASNMAAMRSLSRS